MSEDAYALSGEKGDDMFGDGGDGEEDLGIALQIKCLAAALSEDDSEQIDPYMLVDPASPEQQKITGFPLVTPNSVACWQPQTCIDRWIQMLHSSHPYG